MFSTRKQGKFTAVYKDGAAKPLALFADESDAAYYIRKREVDNSLGGLIEEIHKAPEPAPEMFELKLIGRAPTKRSCKTFD
jgi:hypothetical protein